MRCEQFEQRLQRCLDRRQGPSADSALRRHASFCPQCRETLAAWTRLAAGLDLLELPVPDGGFSQRVVSQIRTDRRWPQAKRRLVGAILAVAVSLLLALLLQFAEPDPVVPSVTERVAATIAVPRLDAKLTDRPSGVPAGPATVTPTGMAADLRLPLVPWKNWPATWSFRTWNPVDRLAGGLSPITAPLGVAVEEIRRTIPFGRDERRTTSSGDSVQGSFRWDAYPVT